MMEEPCTYNVLNNELGFAPGIEGETALALTLGRLQVVAFDVRSA